MRSAGCGVRRCAAKRWHTPLVGGQGSDVAVALCGQRGELPLSWRRGGRMLPLLYAGSVENSPTAGGGRGAAVCGEAVAHSPCRQAGAENLPHSWRRTGGGKTSPPRRAESGAVNGEISPPRLVRWGRGANSPSAGRGRVCTRGSGDSTFQGKKQCGS
jgi:hypothetical protein